MSQAQKNIMSVILFGQAITNKTKKFFIAW